MTTRKHIGLIALFFLVLSIGNATAQAQTTTHQIPYRGYLELNGVSQSGQFDFIFELYDDATAGNLMWSEEFTGVTVAKGRFSVVFGTDTTNNPLSDSIWQEDALYLAIQVKASSDPTFVQLSGRQRILPVPYAARAETAKNYRVTGQLQVDGNISTGDVSITGADNDGTIAALKIESGNGEQMLIDGDEIDSNGALQLNQNSTQPIRLNGLTYLPKFVSPPHTCDATHEGAIYMDIDQGDHHIPCVCMSIAGEYKWAPFDDWNFECN